MTDGSKKPTVVVARRMRRPRKRCRPMSQVTGAAITSVTATLIADCHSENHTRRHVDGKARTRETSDGATNPLTMVSTGATRNTPSHNDTTTSATRAGAGCQTGSPLDKASPMDKASLMVTSACSSQHDVAELLEPFSPPFGNDGWVNC